MEHIRKVVLRLLLLGAYTTFFWGFLYPEFALTQDICVIDETQVPEGMTPEEWEAFLADVTPEEITAFLEEALAEGKVRLTLSFLE